jgi:hypothetical protein
MALTTDHVSPITFSRSCLAFAAIVAILGNWRSRRRSLRETAPTE